MDKGEAIGPRPNGETNVDKSKLTDDQKRFRMNVRNFLMVATREELERELQLSNERKDAFRAACVQELIDELD